MKLTAPFCFDCGKEVQASKAAADQAIATYAHKGHHRSRKLPTTAYPCPSGNGWHLSSKTSRRQPRKT